MCEILGTFYICNCLQYLIKNRTKLIILVMLNIHCLQISQNLPQLANNFRNQHFEAWTNWPTFCKDFFQSSIKFVPKGQIDNKSALAQVRVSHPTDNKSFFNPSPHSARYMHQWIGSALFKIMACRLFSAKPLSKSMLGYCQLDP